MGAPRGLSTKRPNLLAIRGITALAGVLVLVVHVTILLSSPPHDTLLLHSFTVLLIALGIYSWVIFPFPAAVGINVVSAVSVLSATCFSSLTG